MARTVNSEFYVDGQEVRVSRKRVNGIKLRIKSPNGPILVSAPYLANDYMIAAVIRANKPWIAQQRADLQRAAIAKSDAVWDPIDSLFHQFAVPFGLEVTLEGTPEIYKLLTTAIYTIDQMRVAPKAHYKRQRPFERYDEPMLTGEEDNLRGEGSYPSGHALRGQTCALVMAQIAPENADTLFYRAHIYAQSRVIAGAHWQSDVDASRNGATIGYCVLQNCPAFIEQMKKAQKEYRKMKDEK